MSELTLPNFKQENLGGLKIAAFYGLRPHLLGFCGPQEKSASRLILKYLLSDKIPEKKIRRILERFKGAYSYYKVIARCNRIKDHFDEHVVKAYWIGNSLLEKVPVKDLKQIITEEFSGPGLLPKKLAREKADKIPANSKPHHSFHVLVVGSVTGRIILRGKLLDLCRIGWGKTTRLDSVNNRIRVKYQPLIITDKKYRLGKLKEKYIIWNGNLLPKLKIGQQVSFHWNQAVQILTERETKNLQKYTQQTLNSLKIAP